MLSKFVLLLVLDRQLMFRICKLVMILFPGSGEGISNILQLCALCDKFLKFYMVLGMVIRF